MSSQLPPLEGDQNEGPTLVIVSWCFTALAIIAVVARLFGRSVLTHNVGRDDVFILISIVSALCEESCYHLSLQSANKIW